MMTYCKPELIAMNAALEAIRGTHKGGIYAEIAGTDWDTQAAYDVDE